MTVAGGRISASTDAGSAAEPGDVCLSRIILEG